MAKRGRPALGITKKVSLTLTAEEWAEIEVSGQTVAGFLKSLMGIKHVAQGTQTAYPRRYVEERWDIYLDNAKELPDDDVLSAAKASLFNILFPRDSETAVVRTHTQFECPFTGKRYGSMDKLVRAAIPHLIDSAKRDKERKAEMAALRERNLAK